MDEDTEADQATAALLLGTMPERKEEIAAILEDVQYRLVHDRPAMHLEASAFFGKGVVVFTNRTMQQVWLIAYLAWKTLQEQSGFVIVCLAQAAPYSLTDLRVDAKSDQLLALVDRLGEALRDLRTAEVGHNPWPNDVPRLSEDLSELRDVEDRAIYQLSCFAVAFLILHETCHALKRVRGEPEGGIEEEMDCDRYAVSLLLDQIDKYASQEHEDKNKVRTKRAIGVFIGFAIVLESTERGLWTPSDSHPRLHDRIGIVVAAADSIISDPNDDFWIVSCCILLSKLRREERLPERIPFTDSRDLFLKVLDVLNI
jgi:hypothetical protein